MNNGTMRLLLALESANSVALSVAVGVNKLIEIWNESVKVVERSLRDEMMSWVGALSAGDPVEKSVLTSFARESVTEILLTRPSRIGESLSLRPFMLPSELLSGRHN
jgi:hypothetical protein